MYVFEWLVSVVYKEKDTCFALSALLFYFSKYPDKSNICSEGYLMNDVWTNMVTFLLVILFFSDNLFRLSLGCTKDDYFFINPSSTGK